MAGVTQGDTERAQGLDLLFQNIHTFNQTDIQGRCFLNSELHLMKNGRVTQRNLAVGVETAPEGCDNHNGGKRTYVEVLHQLPAARFNSSFCLFSLF